MSKSRIYPPGSKPLTFEDFVAIYSKVPRLCIDLVVKTGEGVLLTKRDIVPWRGQWHLPGGTILFQETLEDAVQRIALEELNLNVAIEKLLDTAEFFNDAKGFEHSVSVTYLVKVLGGDLKVNEEASSAQFFKTLPENTIKEHKEFLISQKLAS